MTQRKGNVVFVEKETSQRCELCGRVEETRPYGPKGERVCFDCGMKNEDATKRAFGRLLDKEKSS